MTTWLEELNTGVKKVERENWRKYPTELVRNLIGKFEGKTWEKMTNAERVLTYLVRTALLNNSELDENGNMKVDVDTFANELDNDMLCETDEVYNLEDEKSAECGVKFYGGEHYVRAYGENDEILKGTAYISEIKAVKYCEFSHRNCVDFEMRIYSKVNDNGNLIESDVVVM